jgi:UDP-N-acetylmuramoyl-L-alanyl-D-glutamate--2,6-diaminopimelate ligase
MGCAAAGAADRVFVTDDNPRSEDPAEIRRAILAAAPDAVEIGDRRRAIETAIAEIGPGDLLVIAGKGHETGQIVGAATFPFDDAEIARETVASRRVSGFRQTNR